MNNDEIDFFRGQLVHLRDRLSDDVSQLSSEAMRGGGGEASGNLSNTPLHLADLGSDTFAEHVTLGLLENQQQVLLQVGEALQRLQDGTYGECQRCRRRISPERLQALPYTPFCVHCARDLQQRGRSMFTY